VEVTYKTAEAVEVEASALGTFVAYLGFATVYALRVDEEPQPASSPFAILNVTGWCTFPDRSRAGLCVMVVGRDAAGRILWASCLMAQPREEEPQQMAELLLVAPEVLGKTTHVTIRASGGRFVNKDGTEPAAAPDHGGR
jgi:hypothetical protein